MLCKRHPNTVLPDSPLTTGIDFTGAVITGIVCSVYQQQGCPDYIVVKTDKGDLVFSGVYWDEGGNDHGCQVATTIENPR